MKKNSLRIPFPKRSALRILQWELPIILLWAVALLVSFLTDFQADPTGASFYYPALVEYITSSLVIALLFAILADLTEREREGG